MLERPTCPCQCLYWSRTIHHAMDIRLACVMFEIEPKPLYNFIYSPPSPTNLFLLLCRIPNQTIALCISHMMGWLTKLGIGIGFFLSSAILATTIPSNGLQANLWMGSHAQDSGGSWNLAKGPGINSTSNFVFETINSLLQHWPNTRYRNGKFNPVVVVRVLPRTLNLSRNSLRSYIGSGNGP
jgi:hypothetical protein